MSGTPAPPRVVIVGAGVAGLAVAHELRRVDPRAEVTVLEAGAQPGGLLRSERIDGYLCEHAASGFLADETATDGALALGRRVGVDLVSAAATAKKRWVWRAGKLHEAPMSPQALLRSDLLSWRGKLRVAVEPLVGRGPPQDESVAAFARRRLGDEATAALVAPMVAGIYAGDAERLSLSAALPRLADMEARHGSLFRGVLAARGKKAMPTQWAPREGMAALPAALAHSLGDAVVYNAPVSGLEPLPGRGVRVRAGDRVIDADALALAVPPSAAATVLAPLDRRLADLLDEIPTVDVTVVHVGIGQDDVAHPLEGFGFLVAPGPATSDPRCLGCVFESSVWPERAPAGCALLRVIYGGRRDPAVIDADDAQLRTWVEEDLRRTLGLRGVPKMVHVVRHRRAIPQYELGHGARIAELERRAAAASVTLAGNAYHGVGVNDVVRDARRVTDLLCQAATGKPRLRQVRS